MCLKNCFPFLTALPLVLGLTGHVSGQGSLTPPGPPGPTMKTLAQIEPREIIDAFPYTIHSPGVYVVTTNLTGTAAENGITILTDNVVVDLNGFTLSGRNDSLKGISFTGARRNVTVRNGTIANWKTGLDATASTQCLFENLQILDNTADGLLAGSQSSIERVVAAGNSGVGISAQQEAIVSSSRVRSNGGHGIIAGADSQVVRCSAGFNVGHGIIAAERSVVRDVQAQSNGLVGIAAGEGSIIKGSASSYNAQTGIASGPGSDVSECGAQYNQQGGFWGQQNNRITRCRAYGNNGSGIRAEAGSTLSDCSAHRNSGDGIVVTALCLVERNHCNNNFNARDAAGLHASGTDNTIQNNTVTANDRGVALDVAGNLVIHNNAANNTINYFINGEQMSGPINSNPNLLEVTHPWSNFAF